MSRIVVLGCAGSGKTAFARELGRRTGAPVICLDDIWQPGWGNDDVPTFRALIKDAHAGDAWISDGNFALATFDIRLPRANLAVWLERPRLLCALRSITRVLEKDTKHRICNLTEVLRFIWNFDRINRPLIEESRIAYGPDVPVRQLTNDREIADFLSSFDVARRKSG